MGVMHTTKDIWEGLKEHERATLVYDQFDSHEKVEGLVRCYRFIREKSLGEFSMYEFDVVDKEGKEITFKIPIWGKKDELLQQAELKFYLDLGGEVTPSIYAKLAELDSRGVKWARDYFFRTADLAVQKYQMLQARALQEVIDKEILRNLRCGIEIDNGR